MTSGRWVDGVRPYVERAPLAALALGVSSAFPLTMINSTLASRLAEAGIEKKSVTAFALVILAYNFKWLWAWIVEGVKIPLLHRLGQRVSWLFVVAVLVCLAAVGLGLSDPKGIAGADRFGGDRAGDCGCDLRHRDRRLSHRTARAASAGRGRRHEPIWLAYRIGAGRVAVARHRDPCGWSVAYMVSCAFALPAVLTAIVMGEPERHHEITAKRPGEGVVRAVIGPFAEFFGGGVLPSSWPLSWCTRSATRSPT